jgi:hypothetical protein
MPDDKASFADIILSVLESWNKFFRLVFLLCISGGMLFGIIYGLLHSLPRNTGRLNLGSGSIIFSQPTQDGHEYLIVIPPQGWQESGIQVRKGDQIHFEAYGRVYIDLAGLNAALAARHDADQRIIAEEKKAGRWDSEKDTFAPEDHYTADDLAKIRPTWKWSDPQGIEDTPKYALPARMKRSILPNGRYGALLGAIPELGSRPTVDDTFLIGASNDVVAKRSGKLSFAVNDVQSNDKAFPEMFFADNIGFFYAKVTVSR